jgi:hypothetical protein
MKGGSGSRDGNESGCAPVIGRAMVAGADGSAGRTGVIRPVEGRMMGML